MMRFFYDHSRPSQLGRLLAAITPVLAVVALALLIVGTYLSFFYAPPDYQQGETVRIMFVHVPAAWWSLASFGFMAITSAVYLVRSHALLALISASVAPAGAACAAVALITGAIWGGPTWGTSWQWGDARLMSMFILMLFYIAYLALPVTIDNSATAHRAQAYCALIGAVNLPIIRFSVDWWQTLHQPASIIRSGGPSIHPVFLWPLLVMALAIALLVVLSGIFELRRRIDSHRVERMLRDQLMD